MVAIKAHQANAFLKSCDARIVAVLFFGTDAGLVAERGRQTAERYAAEDSPPGEIIRLDDADLEQEADRLSIELQTFPMFGGRKVVRATAGRRMGAAQMAPLVEPGALAGRLVVEAGNLKPDDKLRQLFEKSPVAAAVACYPDEGRDIDAVIGEVLAEARLTIAPDARQLLASRLGADRVLSRGEIEKLVLYATGRERVEVADVAAVVGDAAGEGLDRVVEAAALGRGAEALVECDRVVAAGDSPQIVILLLQRHFHRLHRMKTAVEGGRDPETVLKSQRPPLHFKAQDAVRAQLRLWSGERLQDALVRIGEAAAKARLTPALEATLTERLLLELARLAAAGRRG